MKMRVRNVEVGQLIGESPRLRVYLGSLDSGQHVIVKVAKNFYDGNILAEEAGKFKLLSAFGKQVSELEKSQGKAESHYDWLFASLLSSFMEPTQGDRRISVFTMPDIELDQLTPLAKLYSEVKIDARTSAWILGRLLKFYGFFELLAASEDSPFAQYPIFLPGDYLIGPGSHRLIYYNFSGDMADAVAHDFVQVVSKFVLDWTVVSDENLLDKEYWCFVEKLSVSGSKSFEEAHKDLYGLIRRLWGIQYYPFTYRTRGTTAWQVIKGGIM